MLRKSGAVEGSILVDCAREEAFAKWTEWNKADAKFIECWQDLFSGSRHQSEYSLLQGRDALNGMSAPNRLNTCLRHAEVLNLSLRYKFPNCSGDIFRSGHSGPLDADRADQ